MTSKIIIHYCCGSYDQGAHGGVPRYDYHIKLAFPRRIFVAGPQQKVPLLQFLEKHKGNVIVITDNHLACDIPNDTGLFSSSWVCNDNRKKESGMGGAMEKLMYKWTI